MSENVERLSNINIEDEMQRAYIDYSMSVIVGRALPDARDGLKPCNRRILYAMQQGGWMHNRPFVKCARVVGEVMGKYHPHGDSSVYDTLVRMVQEFSMRQTLIIGQGNFGSIDGDPPAAYRYTECRLHQAAEDLLADIEKNTVDMRLNFDEKMYEPTVLPARFPNLLVNGSTGIAVGMATNMPPHNLNEIVDGLVHLIDNEEATIADLMVHIKGPDFPTGGIVMGRNEIVRMYETGRGLIRCRGRAEIEENEKSKDRIIISEIPYAVNKAVMISRMAELVGEKKLEGISDIRDESNKKGIRVVIELKRGAIPKIVLNNIYKQTAMKSTFGANMLALDKNRPKVMNLKQLLICFLDHRYEVLTRRAQFDLDKAEARAHILEGLLIALDHLDDVVKIIRAAKNRDEARSKLMEVYKLSLLQVNAILEMRLYQLTGLEREKLEKEYSEIQALIEDLIDFLASDVRIYGAIKEDLGELKAKYGTPRKTELSIDYTEINAEDLIEDKGCVITITHSGYIKRVSTDAYREQRRGGKGVKGMDTKDEDFVEQVFMASMHDYILFVTVKGRLYWKKVYEIPEGSRTSRGKAIVNLLELNADEKIASLIKVREFTEDQALVMATRKGVVKKTALSAYGNIRAGGIIAINIDEDDELVGIRKVVEGDNIIIVSKNGMSVRFKEDQLRNQGRATRGVRGIRLKSEDDAVVSIEVVDPECTLLTISENGYGKRTSFDEYPTKKRGGKGVITLKTSDRNGSVVAACAVNPDDSLMLISEGGQMIKINLDDLRVISRNTQGVRIFNLPEGDKLVSVAPVKNEDDEVDADTDGEATSEEKPESAEAPSEGVPEEVQEETTDDSEE